MLPPSHQPAAVSGTQRCWQIYSHEGQGDAHVEEVRPGPHEQLPAQQPLGTHLQLVLNRSFVHGHSTQATVSVLPSTVTSRVARLRDTLSQVSGTFLSKVMVVMLRKVETNFREAQHIWRRSLGNLQMSRTLEG
jgi:hypothetical protein